MPGLDQPATPPAAKRAAQSARLAGDRAALEETADEHNATWPSPTAAPADWDYCFGRQSSGAVLSALTLGAQGRKHEEPRGRARPARPSGADRQVVGRMKWR